MHAPPRLALPTLYCRLFFYSCMCDIILNLALNHPRLYKHIRTVSLYKRGPPVGLVHEAVVCPERLAQRGDSDSDEAAILLRMERAWPA